MSATAADSKMQESSPPPPSFERSSGTSLILGFFDDLSRLIVSPSEFFRTLPSDIGIARPLAFAVVVQWITSAIQYLWAIGFRDGVGRRAEAFLRQLWAPANSVLDVETLLSPREDVAALRQRIFDWTVGAGSVLLDPFKTVIGLLFTSALVWAGARLLRRSAQNGRDDFAAAIQVTCFGSAPVILGILPGIGSGLGWIFSVLAMTAGARELYRMSWGRAVLAALFPKLLWLAFVLWAVFLAMIAIGSLVFSMFSTF